MKKQFIKYSMIVALLFMAGCEVTELSQLEKWGLGKEESEYVSLNRDYDWFVEPDMDVLGWQRNCVANCGIMAAMWSDANFSRTVADIRNETYLHSSDNAISGMALTDLYHWLSANDIPCRREDRNNLRLSRFKDQLDNGNIILVGINMNTITYNKNREQRTGRHYLSLVDNSVYLDSTSYVIIVKGYRVVDEITYFEVYDPATSERNPDGANKGKDRYYLATEVINSATRFGGDFLVISPKS